MALPIFPVHLFKPVTVKAKPRARVIDGGVSLTGDQDVISADAGGRWYIEYGDINILDVKIERLWTQWLSFMNGGAAVFLAPVLSLRSAPRPSDGAGLLRPSQLSTDDVAFPTITKFATPYIVATVIGAVETGASVIVINVAQGARIQGGETFSVGNRAYLIERVTARTGQQATCIISPPFRADIANGATVNFEWPVVQVRAVIGQDLSPEFMFNYGKVSLSLVEDFTNAS